MTTLEIEMLIFPFLNILNGNSLNFLFDISAPNSIELRDSKFDSKFNSSASSSTYRWQLNSPNTKLKHFHLLSLPTINYFILLFLHAFAVVTCAVRVIVSFARLQFMWHFRSCCCYVCGPSNIFLLSLCFALRWGLRIFYYYDSHNDDTPQLNVVILLIFFSVEPCGIS